MQVVITKSKFSGIYAMSFDDNDKRLSNTIAYVYEDLDGKCYVRDWNTGETFYTGPKDKCVSVLHLL